MSLVKFSQKYLEKGLLPDAVIRAGIRRLLRNKLRTEWKDNIELGQARKMKVLHQMSCGPIAVATLQANEQHYEVPTQFFQYCLGKHLKYSSGYWRPGVEDLDQGEADMLKITCERADLREGQQVLELGCGWGSLSLVMAKNYPKSQFTGVSNSRTQKEYIDQQCALLGIKNLEIVTADMNQFDTHKRFDRIVSVEMFEHMRNWQKLFEKVAMFLKPGGKLFFHIFTHREFAYFYNEADEEDWIAKYFFTGGVMPSDDLPLYFQEHLLLEDHWRVCGTHYAKTSEAWLKNMDAHKAEILPILKATYGEEEYRKWWVYWRVFFMACAELWGYDNGREWMVSHYRMRKR